MLYYIIPYLLQVMDSELMHSIVGSYLRPPERVFVPTCPQNESHQNHFPVNKQGTSSKVLQSPNSQGNMNVRYSRQLEGWYKRMFVLEILHVSSDAITSNEPRQTSIFNFHFYRLR